MENTMKGNEMINITQASNGFIVTPGSRDRLYSDESVVVFESFASLVIWLGAHFDHRSESVVADSAAKVKRK